MKKRLLLGGALVLLLSFTTHAQIDLLKDINAGKSIGGYPDNIVVFENYIYYASLESITGFELWRSDGTAEGTVLVKDINPGSGGSLPSNFKAADGVLYFSADNGTNGRELWRTNGTASGTYMVSDINAGAGSSNPQGLANGGGKLYFSANEPAHGTELWVSNGNSVGTVLVADLNAGAGSSSPASITWYNNTTYFTADDGSPGAEFWKTDGTAGGTLLVSDIYAQSANADIGFMQPVGPHLVLSARDGAEGNKAWVSDGTTPGTVLLKDISLFFGGNVVPNDHSILNGYLYFAASDSTNEPELWRTDGTTLHTELVATINPAEGIGSNPLNFMVVDSILYFIARRDANFNKFRLYKSNGEIGNYTLVDSRFVAGGSPAFPASFNGKLVFNGGEAGHGDEFYAYNGSTLTLFDLVAGSGSSYPTQLVVLADNLLFSADKGNGRVLWKYDGVSVSQVGTTTDASSNPASFTPAETGVTYFVASDSNGKELWKTNGTSGSTVLVKDINPVGDSSPALLTMMGGILFFTASDGTNGTELWKSDGTAAGTVMIADINTTTGNGSNPADLVVVGNTLFFTASNGKLWKYQDGNVTLVKDTSVPLSLTASGPYLYYVEYNTDPVTFALRCGLWRSDGTTEGTVLITNNLDGCYGPSSSSLALMTFNTSLFFAAHGASDGNELWKYDGTSASLVKDINITSSNSGSNPDNFTVVENSLFFTADDGVHGIELWRTDGTTANTALVKDIRPGTAPGLVTFPSHGPPSPLKAYLASYNGKIYFSANNGVKGFELWTSDGTETGTVLLNDIYPGSTSSNPFNFVVNDSLLYFISDGGGGNVIFVTDGRSCDTRKVTPYAGAATTGVQYLTSAGSILYTSLQAQGIGREPFVVNPAQLNSSGCPAPAPLAQPVALSFSDVTDNSMTVSFTTVSTVPDGYVTLMQAFGSPYPDDAPVNGTTYHTGDVIGSSTIVVHTGLETSFPVIYLIPDIEYNFAVFAYRANGNGYTYLTSNPLEGSQTTLPAAFARRRQKSDAYPNPFSEQVTIPFSTERERTSVTIAIFDFMGNKVRDITDENFEAGQHEITWDGTDHTGNLVNRGMYTYSLMTDEMKSVRQGKLIRQ